MIRESVLERGKTAGKKENRVSLSMPQVGYSREAIGWRDLDLLS